MTPAEHLLAALFAETLGRDTEGIADSFFDLGGHSLLAMRLVSRIRSAIQTQVPMRALFEAPSVAILARRLNADALSSDLDIVLPLRKAGAKRPLFCIHTATGLGWSFAGLVPHVGRDVPVYALQAPALDADTPLDDDVNTPVARYIDALRTIQPQGPYRVLGWSIGGVIAHRIATGLEQLGHTVELLALLDGHPAQRTQANSLTEAQWLRRFIDIVGWPPCEDEMQGERALDVLARMHAQHDRLSALTLAQVHRLFAVFRHLLCMWRDAGLGRVNARTVFFEASGSEPGADALPALWAPHVAPGMAVHRIPCTHDEMASPAMLRTIGALLKGAL